MANNEQKNWLPYMLIAPVVIYYAIFWVGPVLTAFRTSFTTPDGNLTFKYYLTIFHDPYFRQALINTTIIVALSVTLEFFLAFGLALMINKKFAGAGIFLFLAMIPMVIPPVAIGAIWSSGLATYGWLNSLLIHFGLIEPAARIPFLAGGSWSAMLIIILIDAWQVIPFMMIILLGGLQNIGQEKTEAGYVFGGTPWTVCRKITIPLLRPTIQTAMLMRIISAIQIWLIIVMLYGFRRVPVLLEEVMFYQEQLTGDANRRAALAYSVIVAIVVSVVAILYLRLSRASESEKTKA